MKVFFATLLFASSVVAASAQTPAAEPAKPPEAEAAKPSGNGAIKSSDSEAIKLTDNEAMIILKTIEAYAVGNHQKIEVFDRKKGGIVKVRLDKVVTDDTSCIAFPKVDLVAVCGECTQVVPAPAGSKDEKETDGDKYVVWFVVTRESLASAFVKETYVKSVNGKPMYSWKQTADGKLEATLAP